MDLTTLDIFEAVAEYGSVTKAAQKLRRVPSNVSTRIQQLEGELGVALYHRSGKKMALTSEGVIFRRYVQKLREMAEEARRAVAPSKASGSLRVGSMESTAASRLPALLAAFKRTCPNVDLQLILGSSFDLVSEIRNGNLDCAFVALPPRENLAIEFADLSGLQTSDVFSEQLVLVLPGSWPDKITGTEHGNLRLAVLEPGCTYRYLAAQWASQYTNVQICQLGSYHSMLACVVSGAAAGVMPLSVYNLMAWPTAHRLHNLRHVTTALVVNENHRNLALSSFVELAEQLGDATQQRS